jgi:hypothetical protein
VSKARKLKRNGEGKRRPRHKQEIALSGRQRESPLPMLMAQQVVLYTIGLAEQLRWTGVNWLPSVNYGPGLPRRQKL